MDYLAIVFSHMIKKINGNRTIFGAYHILKGKKSAQTLQDSHLFGLAELFGVFKELERNTVIQLIKTLEENRLISPCGEQRYLLTEKGEKFLYEKTTINPLPQKLNGFNYKDVTETFWKRLVLTIQCVSHLKINNNYFMPIIKDSTIQVWVKQLFSSYADSPQRFADQLYHEIETALKEFSSKEATLFVLRLSGVHRVGLTNEQVALKLNVDYFYTHLLFLGTVHRLIEKVYDHKEDYPVLTLFLDRATDQSTLTETAKITLNLLRKNLSVAEIETIRGLKRSTVEDHIVEIAMTFKNFSIEPFVSKEEQFVITTVINELQTKRLKQIKERLHNDVSYFAIRLVLATKETDHGCI